SEIDLRQSDIVLLHVVISSVAASGSTKTTAIISVAIPPNPEKNDVAATPEAPAIPPKTPPTITLLTTFFILLFFSSFHSSKAFFACVCLVFASSKLFCSASSFCRHCWMHPSYSLILACLFFRLVLATLCSWTRDSQRLFVSITSSSTAC